MKKLGKIFKGILITLWVLVLIFWHLSVAAQRELGTRQGVWISILTIVLWWGISIVVLSVWIKMDDKRIQREKQAYQEKYITPVSLEDPFFGHMTLMYDSNLEVLSTDYSSTHFPDFGNDSISYFAIHGWRQELQDSIFRLIEKVYQDASVVSEKCCELVKEIFDEEEITDEEGNPISPEYIRKDFGFSGICVYAENQEDIEIQVTGGMDTDFHEHVDEHGVTASYHSQSGTYEYYSG